MSSSDPTAKPYHGGYSHSNQSSSKPVPGQSGQVLTGGNGNLSYTYTVGSGIGSGAGAIITGANPIGHVAGSFVTVGGGVSLSSPLEVSGMEDAELNTVFTEIEGNQLVFARLAPEYDLTAIEGLRIQQLLVACAAHLYSGGMKPLSYIRKHNLERHFKFSTK